MASGRPLGQALFYALSVALARGLAIVMVPFVTGHLSTTEYGSIELMQSLADVATVVLGFGLVDALYRFIGDARDEPARRRIAAAAFGLTLILGAAAALALLGMSGLIQRLLGPAVDPLALRLLLGSVALDGAIQMPLAWLRLTDRASFYLAMIGLRSLLQAALIVVALEAGWGVPGVMAAGLGAAATTALVLAARQARATGVRLDPQTAGILLRYGSPLVLAGLGGFVLGSFDRLLLAPVVPVAALAEYAIAAKIALIAPLLFQPFGLWWFPRRIVVLGEPDGRERSARTVTFGLTYLTWIGLGTAIGGPVLVTLMTPPAYHGAIRYVPWLVVAAVAQHAGDLLNVGSFTGRGTSRPTVINLASAGVALAAYLLLIPPLGVMGAVIATVTAYGARLVLFLIDSQRLVPLSLPWTRLMLYAGLAAAAAWFTPAGLGWVGGGLVLVVGCAIAGAVALLLGLAPWPSRFRRAA
ncbi:MAG TPA: oligosaccharide flippase family protein [Aliidongia sp.]|nr:oligosaccharide flippase family protein [Aliidongia sp.]